MDPEGGQMEVRWEKLLGMFCYRFQYDKAFSLVVPLLIYLCVSVKEPLSVLQYLICVK